MKLSTQAGLLQKSLAKPKVTHAEANTQTEMPDPPPLERQDKEIQVKLEPPPQLKNQVEYMGIGITKRNNLATWAQRKHRRQDKCAISDYQH